MVKRIYQDITWIPRGCIFSTVQFSRGIHVLSTWIQLPFMSGCLLENQRGFYVYLRGSDLDFMGCFYQIVTKKK